MERSIGDAGARAHAWVERLLRQGLSPGAPLNIATRRLMEAFLGYDLEAVRVYQGHRAQEMAQKLGARAFTFAGKVFAPKLDTQTDEGLGLLAHELAHVIQQTQPHRLPQSGVGFEKASPEPTIRQGNRLPEGKAYSSVSKAMVLPALPTGMSSPAAEAQAEASEQAMKQGLEGSEASSSPEINPEEVADKVYRLMRHDLVLERER